MKNLNEFKQELKNLLPVGIDIVLKSLKENIPSFASNYNKIIELESRFRENHQKLLRGVITNELAILESNRIREAILEFIDSLTEQDFEEPKTDTTTKSKHQTGKILYRIPVMMQVNVETICLVRIAFDEETLTYDMTIQQGDEIKELRRISEVMSVELIDPTENSPFAIRTFSETIQFVDEEDYTEWKFYVKPILEGEFPLLLKVSVIELKLGKERKRDIVLEERVQIVTDTPLKDQPAEMFKEAKETFSMAPSYKLGDTKLANPGILDHPVEIDNPIKKDTLFSRVRGKGKGVTMMFALLVLTSAVWAVPSIREEVRWVITAYVQNDKEAFESYKEQYPNSRRMSIIDAKIEAFEWEEVKDASLEEKAKQLEDYLQKYNETNGRYFQEATNQLVEIKLNNFPEDGKPGQMAEVIKPNNKLADTEQAQVPKSITASEQKEYEQLIVEAEKYYSQEDYHNALSKFETAEGKIADDHEAKKGIEKSNNKLAEIEQEQEPKLISASDQKEYDQFIKKGEKYYSIGNYKRALTKFEAAERKIKGDQKAKEGIERSTNKLTEMELAQKQKEYEQLLTKGDKYYSQKNYKRALSKFKAAEGKVDDDKRAKERIEQSTNKLVEMEQEQIQKEYEQLIAKADKYFSRGDYKSALSNFKAAEGKIEDDQKARKGIENATKKLADLEQEREVKLKEASVQKEYEQLLTKAERYYSKGDYNKALSAFKAAEGKIEDDQKAKEGIANATKKLADMEQEQSPELKPAVPGTSGRVKLRGKTYQWVRLKDGKKWMAENLNYKTEDSWCYEDEESNCEKYGRLYTWSAAKKACPSGWRLPSDQEWSDMSKNYGGYALVASDGGKAAYKALIEGGSSGATAQLGGNRYIDGSFSSIDSYGYYWGSTENLTSLAWYYIFRKPRSEFRRSTSDKAQGFSCRCIQD